MVYEREKKNPNETTRTRWLYPSMDFSGHNNVAVYLIAICVVLGHIALQGMVWCASPLSAIDAALFKYCVINL